MAGVAEALGDVCEHFGAYEPRRRRYERVLRLLPGDPVVETRLCGKRGALAERVGAYEDAFEIYEQGLAPARRAAGRARAGREPHRDRDRRGRRSLPPGPVRGVRRWAEIAAAHAEQAGERGRLAHAYYLIAAAYNELGRPDGLGFCELALSIYEELSTSVAWAGR